MDHAAASGRPALKASDRPCALCATKGSRRRELRRGPDGSRRAQRRFADSGDLPVANGVRFSGRVARHPARSEAASLGLHSTAGENGFTYARTRLLERLHDPLFCRPRRCNNVAWVGKSYNPSPGRRIRFACGRWPFSRRTENLAAVFVPADGDSPPPNRRSCAKRGAVGPTREGCSALTNAACRPFPRSGDRSGRPARGARAAPVDRDSPLATTASMA